jgi:hypothetical protein
MKTYTVVAFEENEGQAITEYIEAENPADACKTFAADREAVDTTVIVEVFEGELKSVHPCSSLIAQYAGQFTDEEGVW